MFGQNHVTLLSMHGTVHGPSTFSNHIASNEGSRLIIRAKHQPITTNINSISVDEVALQGIEFWSNVCDEELTLAAEAEEVN